MEATAPIRRPLRQSKQEMMLAWTRMVAGEVVRSAWILGILGYWMKLLMTKMEKAADRTDFREKNGSSFEHVELEIHIMSKWKCQVDGYKFIKWEKVIIQLFDQA